MKDYMAIGKTQTSLAKIVENDVENGFVANENYPELILKHKHLTHSVWINVSIKGARLEKCDFTHSVFVNCYFRNASFQNCTFTGCRFVDCIFSAKKILGCHFSYSRWENTEISRRNMLGNLPPEPNLAQKLLIQLRLNASTIGAYDDARYYLREAEKRSRAHYAEIIKCRDDYYKKYRLSLDRLKAPFRYMMSFLNKYLWGYGERPLLLTCWGFVIILVFGFLHSNGNDASDFLNGIKISIGSFTNVFPITYTTGHTPSIWHVLESLFGLLYIAFLAASLHRRVSTRED